MIPIFPEFKFLEWPDRSDVENFTAEFPPYSDYNFISLWSWNTQNKIKLSQLKGNLVVLFYDYVSGEPFLSFVGKNELIETAIALLEYSQKEYNCNCLKLIPESTALLLQDFAFTIIPDRSSFDYILSVPYLMNLPYHTPVTDASKKCNRFMQSYPDILIKFQSLIEVNKQSLIEMFISWSEVKNQDHNELPEYTAFGRLLQNENINSYVLSLHDQDLLIGFVVLEICSNEYAVNHFAKANVAYRGIYDRLNWESGKVLHKQGAKYLNFEQDLGIVGLRRYKEKYKPVFYLRKYVLKASVTY